jgi:hypothetical protein
LTILSLISIPIPGIAQSILGIILSLTQLDVLPSDKIYAFLFSFNAEEEEPISDYFDDAGYSTKNALQNMGSAAIFLLINFSLLINIGAFKIVK